MKFKATKQIQKMVEEFNQIRNKRSILPLAVSVDKFAKGEWSVNIWIPTDGAFFSRECSALFPLLAQLDCTFFIGTCGGDCIIFIQ